MSTMLDNKCRVCEKEFDSLESVFRHVKVHKMKASEYVLKWKHDGQVPLCACGCGGENSWNVSLKDFTRFIHGHHANGRVKSDEEKAKIGKKNSENMKRWMSLHPEVAKKRVKQLEKGRTPEVYKKISESVRRFWAESPLAGRLRQEASERAIQLLSENKIGPQAPFKTEWVMSPWTGKQEYMHSSWETAFFQTCVARRYEVTKNHGIVIPYTHPDGTVHSYIPDFYAPEDRTLYEMKGRYDEVDIAKWEAAQRFCEDLRWNFTVMLGPEVDAVGSFDVPNA